jgi:tRNA (cytidine32/uridine32-2'-O)-methyltransferase
MNLFDNACFKSLSMCVLSWSIPPPANIGSALTRHENDGTLKLVLVAPKTYPHPDIDALQRVHRI